VKRFIIDLQQMTVTNHTLLDLWPLFAELPRINDNLRGLKYCIVYMIRAIKKDTKVSGTGIFKLNVCNGEKIQWSQEGQWASEPVFIPNPNSNNEDDGILLTAVLDDDLGQTYLLILDASTMKEVAKTEPSIHMPFGTHGIFNDIKV